MMDVIATCILYIITCIFYFLRPEVSGFRAEKVGGGFRAEKVGSNTRDGMPYETVCKISNPDFVIRDVVANGLNLKLIDESHLVGGSKQRIITQKIRSLPEHITELVYAGPDTGYAQVALSYCCRMLGKIATIFINGTSSSKNELTRVAESLGGRIRYFDARGAKKPRLDSIQSKAKEYAAEHKSRYVIPFGMMDEESMRTYLDVFQPLKSMVAPVRIWTVAGSGLIFTVLSKLFGVKMMIVQVGKHILPEQLEGIDHDLFVSSLPFAEKIPEPHPPYDTLLNYDAKVWEFVLAHGKPGDVIWNTAGNPWSIERIDAVNRDIRAKLAQWTLVEARVIKESRNKTFPYVKTILDPPLVMFERLRQRIRDLDTTTNIIRRDYKVDYNDIDGISNHFTEIHRMNCFMNIRKKITPHKFWDEYRLIIARNAYRLGRGTIDDFVPSWRGAMQIMWPYKECSTFNPFILADSVKRYFPGESIRILDPSMGWGDRLIGALACGMDYVGFDPNKKLHPCYDKIYATLGRGTSATFIPSKFNKAEIAKRGIPADFDLAFTSPPFYDLEIYEGTEIDVRKTYQSWLKDMYIPYLQDMVALVKPRGYIVIYTSNLRVINLGDDTRKIVEESGAEFVEMLHFIHRRQSDEKPQPETPRPIYVFRKF